MIQAMFDRHYLHAYDKAEMLMLAGTITVDEFIQRTHLASERAWSLIEKKTGYRRSGRTTQ